MEGLKAACFFVLFLWVLGIVGATDSEDTELASSYSTPINPLHVVNATLGE
jgi:hypothetical protein